MDTKGKEGTENNVLLNGRIRQAGSGQLARFRELRAIEIG
jgi:hypothetical protein